MARQKRHKDYEALTVFELRQLLQRRIDDVPGDFKFKRQFVNRLRQEDRKIFRFLQLPPELRNRIYQALLHLETKEGVVKGRHGRRTPKRCCWPQILAVCKQILQEAESILYGANEFSLRIAETYRSRRQPRPVLGRPPNVHMTFTDLNLKLRTFSSLSLRRLDMELPDVLCRIQNLKIHITLNTGPDHALDSRPFCGANRQLYILCSFLSDNKRLKKVEVVANVDDPAKIDQDALSIFWPIAKLRCAELTICGLLEEVTSGLVSLREKMEITTNAFHAARRLELRATQLLSIMRLLDLTKLQLHDFKEQVQQARPPLGYTLGWVGYVDERQDDCLTRCIDKFREQIDDGGSGLRQ